MLIFGQSSSTREPPGAKIAFNADTSLLHIH